MSFTEEDSAQGFPINLDSTTELIGRFHDKLMVRRSIDWEALRSRDYDDALRRQARREWASRAVAEYYSTSQDAGTDAADVASQSELRSIATHSGD